MQVIDMVVLYSHALESSPMTQLLNEAVFFSSCSRRRLDDGDVEMMLRQFGFQHWVHTIVHLPGPLL